MQLAQGALESGWSTTRSYNSFFNITNDWHNPPSDVVNSPYTTAANWWSSASHWFRSYSDARSAWLDYGYFLKHDPNYTSAWNDVGNPRQFLVDVFHTYAPDGNLTTILSIYDTYTSQYGADGNGASPPPPSNCPGPSLNSPSDGYVSSSRTVTFSWNPSSGCTFSGYTFRVKNVATMDSGGATLIDMGEGGTSRTETINAYDNTDLYWGVRTANPLSPNWSVRRFRIEPSISAPAPGPAPAPVPQPQPGIPTLLNPSDGASFQVGQTIAFSWSNTGASQYKFEAWNDSAPGVGQWLRVNATGYSFAADRAGSWRWQVRSIKTDGAEGDAPPTRSFTVQATPVIGACDVDFVAESATSGPAPLTVRFAHRNPSPGISNWRWDFGDGGSSADPSTNHIYQNPGSYTVSLTVSGPCGSKTVTKPNMITVSPFPGNPGLVGSWNFDEGSGSTSADLSDNGNTAQLVSATWTTGIRGGGVHFGGERAAGVRINASSSLQSNTFTFSAWVRPSASPEVIAIGTQGESNVGERWALNQRSDKVELMVWSSGGSSSAMSEGGMLAQGQWTFIGVSFDGLNVKFYDQKEQRGATRTLPIGGINSGVSTLYLGSTFGSVHNQESFRGDMDEVRYYNSVVVPVPSTPTPTPAPTFTPTRTATPTPTFTPTPTRVPATATPTPCVPSTVPPAPTLLAPPDGGSVSTTTPSLAWAAAPSSYCVDYYNIQIDNTSVNAWAAGQSYTIPSGILAWGKQYRWWVWAHNSQGFGSASGQSFWVGVTATPSPTATPQPPPWTPTATPPLPGGGGGFPPTPTRTPIPTRTPTPTPTPPTDRIRLAEGWNLISIPKAVADSSVSGILAGVGTVDKVYTYSGGTWQVATFAGGAWSGSLTDLKPGLAYWVKTTTATTVALSYKPVDPLEPLPTYSLEADWNLIGYTTLSLLPTQPVSVYLNSLSGKWTALYNFDSQTGYGMAKPGFGFPNVELFRGYNIYLTEPGTLVP
ncbi:MAG: PKD domain-containing protein [Chloroflexi bacterium]|nr:PKD domain-containing protein [Chloroflexota bacterium]